MKNFGEPSTRLEFDEFDESTVDEGQPGTKSSDQQRSEGVDGSGDDGEEGKESGSNQKDKSKPPTVDEYQWQWKVSDLSSRIMPCRIDQAPQPKLETTRRTFFL